MKRFLTLIFSLLAARVVAYAPGPQPVSPTAYSANLLNQYSSRDVPGAVDVTGATLFTNAVTVNGVAAARQREYFWSEAAITNGSSAAWQGITVSIAGSNVTGNVFLPKSPETLLYDLDGNLTNDGRWTFTWDGENRLISMVSKTNTPSGSRRGLRFSYDWQGRRISKVVSNWTGSAWSLVASNKFLYDGWNLVAELSGTNNTPIRTFLWGSDVSGGDAAGGVGGLLAVRTYGAAAGTNFVAMDGNGNVSALVSASDGRVTANYDYAPFGELVRAEGPMAKGNPFRFSTKYQDEESDLLYYGLRYYRTDTGGWLSRDPIEEAGGANLYGFVLGDPVNAIDVIGLAATFEGTAGNYHVNFSRTLGAPAYTVGLNSSGGLVFGSMNPHPFPGQAGSQAHFAANFNPNGNPKIQQAYGEMRRTLHNDFIKQLEKGKLDLAERIGELGKATRRGRMPTADTVGTGRMRGRLGGTLGVLGLGLFVFNAQAHADAINNSFMDYLQEKCKPNNDDWAFVSELVARHEMNQLALFSGDVWMFGNRVHEYNKKAACNPCSREP